MGIRTGAPEKLGIWSRGYPLENTGKPKSLSNRPEVKVQFPFFYQDDCILKPHELFLDTETTCRAEMKPVTRRFDPFPDQFVREVKLVADR